MPLTATDLLLWVIATLGIGAMMALWMIPLAGFAVFAWRAGFSYGRHHERWRLSGGWWHWVVGVATPIVGVLVVIIAANASYLPPPVRNAALPVDGTAVMIAGAVLTLVSWYSYGFIGGRERERQRRIQEAERERLTGPRPQRRVSGAE